MRANLFAADTLVKILSVLISQSSQKGVSVEDSLGNDEQIVPRCERYNVYAELRRTCYQYIDVSIRAKDHSIEMTVALW